MGIQRKFFSKKSPGLEFCFGKIQLNVGSFIVYCQTEVLLLFWSLWHNYDTDYIYTGFWTVSNITFLQYNLLIPISCDPVINGKEDLDVQCVFSWLGFLLIDNFRNREGVEGSERSNTTITIVTKTSVFNNAVFYTWNSFLNFISAHFLITDYFITWQIFLWPPSTKLFPDFSQWFVNVFVF